jgi:hypothetical protein
MGFLFLEHTYRWLLEDGVLLMVVPQARLESSIPLAVENFADIRVFRLTDPESERFDQVAFSGCAKKMRGQDYSRKRAALHEMVWRRDVPTLQGNETPYRVGHRVERMGVRNSGFLSPHARFAESKGDFGQ